MKKLSLWLLVLWVLGACQAPAQEEPLMTLALASTKEDQETQYYLLDQAGQKTPTDQWTPDQTALEAYDTMDLFRSQLEGNRVVNTYVGQVEDPEKAAFFQALAQEMDSEIFGPLVLFQDPAQAKFYALVQVNVNWISPAYLMEYDRASQALHQLQEWQDVDLVGVSFAPAP